MLFLLQVLILVVMAPISLVLALLAMALRAPRKATDVRNETLPDVRRDETAV